MTPSPDPRLRRSRTALAHFLRSRREQINPQSLNLPDTGHRRTPGLRREEVAALAGVGLTWYTWLEQGRAIKVSTDLLDSLSRVLQLNDFEHRHLYALAGKNPPSEKEKLPHKIPQAVPYLLTQINTPAYILTHTWDVPHWNNAADRLFEFSAQADSHPNMLRMIFSDTSLQRRLTPWQQQARGIMNSAKRDFAQNHDSTKFAQLIEELSDSNSFFQEWWNQPDIDGKCTGLRTFTIKGLGEIILHHTTMKLESDPTLRLVYYTPDTSNQKQFLDWLEE